jgi:2-oxoglutarate ferredoxin oxidoreductase subunit beta
MSRQTEWLSPETAWCPGCGNFAIREALAEALGELGFQRHEVVMCSGIGQAAKMPHYLLVNGFNGLHGRALPPAFGARVANHRLKTVVVSGDGCTYGEGGNHLLHTIRRNPELTHIVHNNQVYGLTKGQASPTSELGMRTGVQTAGVILQPLQPLPLALVMGAGFVARGYAGDRAGLKGLMIEALRFRGYALLDILQPCPSFNKLNTYAWYGQRVYTLDGHDPTDWEAAMRVAREWGERIPLGVFYRVERPTYESQVPALRGEAPLAWREFSPVAVAGEQEEYR